MPMLSEQWGTLYRITTRKTIDFFEYMNVFVYFHFQDYYVSLHLFIENTQFIPFIYAQLLYIFIKNMQTC